MWIQLILAFARRRYTTLVDPQVLNHKIDTYTQYSYPNREIIYLVITTTLRPISLFFLYYIQKGTKGCPLVVNIADFNPCLPDYLPNNLIITILCQCLFLIQMRVPGTQRESYQRDTYTVSFVSFHHIQR